MSKRCVHVQHGGPDAEVPDEGSEDGNPDEGSDGNPDESSFTDDGKEPVRVPPAALSECWGPGGSWMLSALLPAGGIWTRQVERPFAVRELRAVPAHLRGAPAGALLEQWGVGVVNSKGRKGVAGSVATALGQDNFCIARLRSGWEVFGVFDGHGSNGHWPSERVARTMPFFLHGQCCTKLLQEGNAEGALHHAFACAERDVEAQARRERVDIRTSGTTAVVALRHHQRPGDVWVGTAGDSRAALVTVDGVVEQETDDHKPSRPDERARIVACGGRVSSRVGEGSDVDCRVYHQGTDYPGIAVSRSLGDCGIKSIGVCAEPEVVRWPVEASEGSFLLLCSDGVWEFMTTQQACSFVADELRVGSTPDEALHKLLLAARTKWKTHISGPPYCDDITAMLAPLGPEVKGPRWDSLHIARAAGHDTKAGPSSLMGGAGCLFLGDPRTEHSCSWVQAPCCSSGRGCDLEDSDDVASLSAASSPASVGEWKNSSSPGARASGCSACHLQ